MAFNTEERLKRTSRPLHCAKSGVHLQRGKCGMPRSTDKPRRAKLRAFYWPLPSSLNTLDCSLCLIVVS